MVLVLVTAIGLIVGILAMSMVDLGFRARLLARRDVEGISAHTLADAGVADAVFWMQRKLVREPRWQEVGFFPRTVTSVLPGANGSYTYTISVVTSGSEFQIDSTGSAGNQSRTIHEILHVGSRWEGIGVLTDFEAKVDASFQGDLDIHTNSRRASEGQITLKAGVIVPGDVIIGPGVINAKASVIIQGDMYAADEELVFPPVSAPTPVITISAITKSTTMAAGGTYQCPSISLPKSGQLVITAAGVRLYVVGNMEMKNSAEVMVQPGASLELYLGGSLDGKNSAGFSNCANDPRALKVYGLPACTSVDFKAKSSLHAALYVPSADITLYNSATFYGAVCARSMEMKNSSVFSFDDRVKAIMIDDTAAVFESERWWED